jgi:hypothetical protein
MRASNNPMIVCRFAHSVWVGVASAMVTRKHVRNPDLIRRRSMFHHGVYEFHAVGVVAHLVCAHDHARKLVLPFAQRAHASVCLHPDDRGSLPNSFWGRG